MKKIIDITLDSSSYKISHILSEPGDMTRYDYFVYEDCDEYCFMPCNNTFRYPQKLNYWDTKILTEDQLMALAKKENCNPSTLRECIDTIKSLRGKK